MKLSEAIRLGAMMAPEHRGPYWIRYDNGQVCGTCAMGAAYHAGGLIHSHTFLVPDSEARQTFPVLAKKVPIPDGTLVADLEEVVIHLFEWKKWTREQIADWVETIEQAQDAKVAPVPVTVEA